MDDDLEGIVLNIRACIMSSKGPIPIRNLSREYECIVGSQIPYRRLNYSNLEDFLKSIPSLRVCGSGSQAMVEAAATSASKHIAALISKQKSTSRKFTQPPPYISSRGGRGRGRGNYHLRSSAPREYPTRDYNNDRDSVGTRDYTARKPTRDYSAREPTWDYSAKEPTREKTAKDYPTRDQSLVDYEAGDPPKSKRYSPNLQNRHDTGQASGRPITVKVEDDKRQVSFSSSRKSRLPPRLQRLRQQNAEAHTTPLVSSGSQGFETDLLLDQSNSVSNSASIISPLGPSQLIAAGRAKQQAEKAKLEQQYYQNISSDFLLSLSDQETNNLAMDFTQLSHKNTVKGSLRNDQASFNGQKLQIAEEASVTQTDVPLPRPEELSIENSMGLLQRYCMSRFWPNPSYTVLHHRCPDTHKVMYFASVKVNGNGANTFKIGTLPFEHENVNIVKGYASKIALMKIIEEESKVKADKIISSNTSIICNRISEIVSRASTGLFAKSVEDEYVERYNELLPADWLDTVSKWPAVSVESTVNSTIIVPRDPTAQVQFDPTCEPPLLPVEALGNDEGIEDVYVTHATSVSNVCFRVIGKDYSEKYEVLLEDMDRYYKGVGAQELALMLEEGQYYAAHKFDTWFRVCVSKVDEVNKTVLAWLIDLGGEDQFMFGSLYRLAPQFCQLPQQAVSCTLEGIESFSEDDTASEIVANSKLLIDKTLVAKISHKDTLSVKATLYDTSGEDDINVNEQIKDEIITKSRPVLPAEGCVKEVVIGHVSKKGEVYIMFAGPSLDCVMEVIDSLGSEKISEHKLTSFKHISLNKLYLAKYSKDDIWYRAVVTTTPSMQHNKIPVRFIDYGNTESVTISDIADLEKLPTILKMLPPQAVKVALHNLPLETLTNPEVARLHSLLLDEDKVVLLKTVSLKTDPPTVEIFTKEADNATLMSVNSKIELQRKLYNRNEDKTNLFNPLNPEDSANQFNNNLDEFDLENPDFSENEFQAVLIPLAAHPGYFIFQPAKYNKDLKTLRQQMCAYYDAGALSELPIERVMKNKLFAAQFDDEMWYRVLVTESPSGTKVAVRLCDYGDVSIVNISSLRELAPEFHNYPFMAIKGKLAGVRPIHKDWSVEDCIRFQSLVVNQVLAGVIKKIDLNHNPMDMVVTLILVNTSSDKDQYIAKILLDELRAMRDD